MNGVKRNTHEYQKHARADIRQARRERGETNEHDTKSEVDEAGTEPHRLSDDDCDRMHNMARARRHRDEGIAGDWILHIKRDGIVRRLRRRDSGACGNHCHRQGNRMSYGVGGIQARRERNSIRQATLTGAARTATTENSESHPSIPITASQHDRVIVAICHSSKPVPELAY